MSARPLSCRGLEVIRWDPIAPRSIIRWRCTSRNDCCIWTRVGGFPHFASRREPKLLFILLKLCDVCDLDPLEVPVFSA